MYLGSSRNAFLLVSIVIIQKLQILSVDDYRATAWKYILLYFTEDYRDIQVRIQRVASGLKPKAINGIWLDTTEN